MVDAQEIQIHIPDEDIEDLRDRLRRRRCVKTGLTHGLVDTEEKWARGVDPHALEELLEYWEKEFDWRKAEAQLNSFHHHLAKIRNEDGEHEIHYIHEKSPHPNAIPIIMVHGWPGSVIEFLDVISELVNDNRRPFHVVVPSIPGYGLSKAERGGTYNARSTARIFDQLMLELGYSQYVAQGGDWGSAVVGELGCLFPKTCVATHTNLPLLMPITRGQPLRTLYHLTLVLGSFLTPKLVLKNEHEERSMENVRNYLANGSSYFLFHATKPEQLGVMMHDSPTALAAWIFEKFHAWTDRQGTDTPAISKDQILTNISWYWFTNSISSSMRYYYDNVPVMPKVKDMGKDAVYGHAPHGATLLPGEILGAPKAVVRQTRNLKSYTYHPVGGHFAIFEQPQLMKQEIQKFFYETIDFQTCKDEALGRNPDDIPTTPIIPMRKVWPIMAGISSLFILSKL